MDRASLAQVKKDVQQLLAGVYAPSQIAEILPQILELIKQKPQYKTQKSWLDQTDVMLISYGDSIIKEGESPLYTLYNFLDYYASDILSAVHILPCYPYTSDDGFSVVDYWAINPSLGDWGDIHRLSEKYDLMFDGVINHISKSSDWFQRYLKGEEPYVHFFTEANPNRDYSSVTRPRALPLLTTFETNRGEKHIWTTFSEDQIDLNYRCPDVFVKIVELLLFYAEQGATYIRLDAIGFMWKELDMPCIHQPQTHALVQAMRAIIDVYAPHLKLITETNVPHKDNVSYFGNGYNEAHLVYQFPLPPLMLYTIQTGHSAKIMQWLGELGTTSEHTTFFNFLASHDGIGVRPVEGILGRDQVELMIARVKENGGRVSYKDNGDGTQSPYELNINYFNAVSNPEGDDEENVRRFIAAQAVLLSLAGVPGIYVHSLLGSQNDLDGLDRLGYNRAINREKLNYDELVQELHEDNSLRRQILSALKALIAIRKEHVAFAPNASQRIIQVSNQLITLVRGETVAVVINISNQPTEIASEVLLNNLKKDLITGSAVSGDITVQPYQVMWLIQ